jgi:hypothetical protein
MGGVSRHAVPGIVLASTLAAIVVGCSSHSGPGIATGKLPFCGPASKVGAHVLVRVKHNGKLIRSQMFSINGQTDTYRFSLPAGTYAINAVNFPVTSVSVTAGHATDKSLRTVPCL